MTAKHTERAFEDAIEHALTEVGGWASGNAHAFDRETGVIVAFSGMVIRATALSSPSPR